MRVFRTLIICLSVIIFIILLLFGIIFYRFIHTPLTSHKIKVPTTVIIYPGMTVQNLVTSLESRQLLSHSFYFHLLALIKRAHLRMRVGEYLITNQTTPNQLLDAVLRGKIYMRKITFIEGWTFNQIKEALSKNVYLKHTVQNDSNQQILQLMGAKEVTSPEGIFFPDTYEYTWGNKDSLILKVAYQHMQKFLQNSWNQRAKDLPYHNAYEALIVASMVERETPRAEERPIIAGIILQRMKKGMRLQIDPTVLYGIGKSYKETITKADLLDPNPYNTYRHKGLPPTPISMPSKISILAALHPKQTDYLYFVAKGDGTHQFSATYQAQRVAVTHYRNSFKKINQPNIVVLNFGNFEQWYFSTVIFKKNSVEQLLPIRQSK